MVDSLLEFRDEDGDGAYDVGEPVLQRHALANISAQIIAPAASIREASYPLSGNGSLVLRFHLEAGGVDEAVKFDVVIRNYAFTNPESRLALGMRMESTQAFRSGSVADEEALMGDGFGERPYVSWAADAVADNASVPVTAAVYLGASGHDALVFWSYAQAVSIEHDPWLGYVFVPVETLGDAVVFVGALVGGALVFLAGFEARRRFRP